MSTMSTAIDRFGESMRRFGEAMQQAVGDGARRLASDFAARHRSHVASIEWGEHDNGDASVVITLKDGHTLRGRAAGKLDALVVAESVLDEAVKE